MMNPAIIEEIRPVQLYIRGKRTELKDDNLNARMADVVSRILTRMNLPQDAKCVISLSAERITTFKANGDKDIDLEITDTALSKELQSLREEIGSEAHLNIAIATKETMNALQRLDDLRNTALSDMEKKAKAKLRRSETYNKLKNTFKRPKNQPKNTPIDQPITPRVAQ
jgi:hypothetical protein